MSNEPIYNANPVYPEIALHRPPNHEQCARETFGLTEAWEAIGWERKNFDTPHEYLLLKGGVYPEKLLRGPRKGETNYKKPAPGSYCELHITYAALKMWLSRWEDETGLCRHCKGSGWKWAGWESGKGTKHRKCPHCRATGIKQRDAA